VDNNCVSIAEPVNAAVRPAAAQSTTALTIDAGAVTGDRLNITLTNSPTVGLSAPTDHKVITAHFVASAANRTVTFDPASVVPAGGRGMSFLIPQNEVLIAEFRYIGNRGTPRWALVRAEVTGLSAVAVQAEYLAAALSTPSTSYVYLANSPTAVFVAPPSGVVRLDYSGALVHSTAGMTAAWTPEVRTGATPGSGTVVLAASDNNRGSVKGSNDVEATRSMLLTGLIPGAQYNMRMLHISVNTGTAYFARLRVAVTPIGLA
jgi:hypothetical protein